MKVVNAVNIIVSLKQNVLMDVRYTEQFNLTGEKCSDTYCLTSNCNQ